MRMTAQSDLVEVTPRTLRIMSTVIADLRHLPGLVAELEAAGYTVDICPDDLKPIDFLEDEFVEVTRGVPDREQLMPMLHAMLAEISDICERHEAFCDECEELPPHHDPHVCQSPTWQAWRAIDAAKPHELN